MVFSDFTDLDLGRILHVFPGAYRLQALKIFDGGQELKTYQLEWPVADGVKFADKMNGSKVTEERKRRFKEALAQLEIRDNQDIPSASLPAFKELLSSSSTAKTPLRDLLAMKKEVNNSTANAYSTTPTKPLSVLEKVRMKEQRRKELDAERAKLSSAADEAKQSRLPQIINYLDGYVVCRVNFD